MTVRPAAAGDAAAVADLLAVLGYPAPTAEVEARLERFEAIAGAAVLVAEAGGEVVGVAGATPVHQLDHDRPTYRLTVLAVRDDARRSGIGSALVAAVEEEARRQGCYRVEVTHRPDRREAHALYRALGFEDRPHRLVKVLAS